MSAVLAAPHSGAMALDVIPLQPVEPGYRHVLRIRSGCWAAVLVIAAGLGELLASAELPFPGVVLVPVLAFAVWSAGIAPGRRWRRWGYAFTGTELHVAQGLLVRIHTIVPVARVQHIDVVQGPLERLFGLTALALHTAGSEDSVVVLPGITRATAESIRDAIRERIGGM